MQIILFDEWKCNAWKFPKVYNLKNTNYLMLNVNALLTDLNYFSPRRCKGVAHPEIKDLRKIMPILFVVILLSIKCQIIKRRLLMCAQIIKSYRQVNIRKCVSFYIIPFFVFYDQAASLQSWSGQTIKKIEIFNS